MTLEGSPFGELGQGQRCIDDALPTTQELEGIFDRLWPICRSLAGPGFRESMAIIREVISLEILSWKTGDKVLDWTIPNEWTIKEAWIEDERGTRVVDFARSNLHVVGYSTPVDAWMTLDELDTHLHSLPQQPEAIPYLTSYYKERWGFCLAHSVRKHLEPGRYRAVIRSSLERGRLEVGHLVLPSTEDSKEEILISSYLCHPSLANNELSGPILVAYLYRALAGRPRRRFNVRFVIGPETIGAVAYLSRYGEHLKKNMRAGLVATCCGDGRAITYKRSRRGNTEVDRVVGRVLQAHGKPHEVLDFFPAGSDERQYCSPGFDLPVGSLMRSMYGTYPEYHTSLDDKAFISFEALRTSVALYLECVLSLDANRTYRNTQPYGEPMLGPRGLYPSLGSQKEADNAVVRMMWLLNQSDGSHDLCAIAEKARCSILDLAELATVLEARGLLASP